MSQYFSFSSLQLSESTSHATDLSKTTPSIPSQRQKRNTMAPPLQQAPALAASRAGGCREQSTSDKQTSDQQSQHWISGIITCLRPVWSFIGRTALEEKLKG